LKYLIVIICLFLPNKSYEIYHVVLTAPIAFYLLLNRKIHVNIYVIFILAGIGLLWLFALMRGIYFDSYALRDYLEIARFVPLLLLILINPSFDPKKLTVIFFTYVSFDFLISISQFFMIDALGFFTNFYGSAYHLDTSLFLNNRATGLSTGPGQHGTIMTLFYVYFLFLYLFNLRMGKLAAFGAVLSIGSILLSQSQTSFIASLLISGWMAVYTLWNGSYKSKLKSVRLGVVGVLLGTGIFVAFFQQLRYLFSLFTLGLERNSFQRRLGKVDVVKDAVYQYPEMVGTGFGNSFFGNFARAMDNEYMYIFSVYGAIIGGTMFFFVFLFIGIAYYKGLSISARYLLIAFILTVGLVIAYPTVFFTESRIMFLIGVLFFSDFMKIQPLPSLKHP